VEGWLPQRDAVSIESPSRFDKLQKLGSALLELQKQQTFKLKSCYELLESVFGSHAGAQNT
jgi:hypothetical protein